MNTPLTTFAPSLTSRLTSLSLFSKIGIGSAIILIAGGLSLYHYSFRSNAMEVAVERTPTGTFHPTKSQFEALKIATVQTVNFRSLQITDGNIASNDDTTTPVFSPYSGHVSRIYAKLGDVVSKGTPLMAVEASEFVQGQTDLISAIAALKSAQAQFKLTQTAEQRQHELYAAKAGALKDWYQSQADLATAEGTLRSAEIGLGAVRNRLRILGKSDDEISALENDSNNQKMNPEAIVRSPISGTVILRQVGLGQNIQSAAVGASNPMFAIANLGTVWLIANVRETDAPFIKVGTPIEVSVLALPGRLFKAKINWISPSIDPNTHRLAVRAEIANHDGALKPAMFATFRLITGEVSSSPGVSQSSIVYEGAEAHVFVADKDNNVMLRPIHTGRINDDLVEVISGLKVGEKIVTSGALFIDRALESN